VSSERANKQLNEIRKMQKGRFNEDIKILKKLN
jgi:hypothetical protein